MFLCYMLKKITGVSYIENTIILMFLKNFTNFIQTCMKSYLCEVISQIPDPNTSQNIYWDVLGCIGMHIFL